VSTTPVRGNNQRWRGQTDRKINGIPPICHWSILGSQRPCLRWFVPGWHRGEYRGKGRLELHPSRCRYGAPKCLERRPCGLGMRKSFLRFDSRCWIFFEKKRRSTRYVELFVQCGMKFCWLEWISPEWAQAWTDWRTNVAAANCRAGLGENCDFDLLSLAGANEK
jgi:hypothetical protein